MKFLIFNKLIQNVSFQNEEEREREIKNEVFLKSGYYCSA